MYTEDHRKWDEDLGNLYLVANYPLNQDSWVIELGGYKGVWSNRIISDFDCKILII